jgi:hypothetical protein
MIADGSPKREPASSTRDWALPLAERIFTGMRTQLIALSGILLAVGMNHAMAADRPLTVVELFTSEGCNSCPPADAYLGKLVQRDDVLALSYHVDYWDYLGWKDTLSSKVLTERQYAYRQSLGSSYVYTPQMVIGGATHASGGDEEAVDAAIAKAEKASAMTATVNAARGPDGTITVSLAAGKAGGNAVLWLVRYDDEHAVTIERGENAGSTIAYRNVVRDISKLGKWDGKATEVTVDPTALNGADHAVVLLQANGNGPILGCAKLPKKQGS